jgi:hypothetical protein
MNTIEDKVRLALRDTGEEIGPRSVPPLRLQGTRRARLPRIPGRWGTWLTPLAAAAAVAAVVAASLAISTTFHGHTRATGPATAARWNGSPVGPPSALRKVPPYFVALSGRTQSEGDYRAVVRSTVTGRTLATVTPPRPYRVFTWVSGAADDRTFVLAAQRYWHIGHGQAGAAAQNRDNTTPTVFFKLTLAPATHAATLTRLSVPGPIHFLYGMAVSPDGTRLALDLDLKSVQVVTLATGTVRSWVWHGKGNIGNWKPMGQIFSWSADGRYLAFQQWGGHLGETMRVRVLDTSAPGTSLTAAKAVVAFPYSGGTLATMNAFLTPDGTKIVAATSFYPPHHTGPGGYVQITTYSASTGKPVLHQDRFSASIGWQNVLWSSPDGSALVLSDPRGAKDQYGARSNILGVLVNNKFTPIPHGAGESAYEFTNLAW